MVRILHSVYGIRYVPAKIPEDVPLEPEDSYIHGALLGAGGTCASLPVVYVAVARRLGYPVKLVECSRHLFWRWDEPGGERFNIDGNDRGVDSRSDDYYRIGHFACRPGEEEHRGFLLSMTPRMELAGFLIQRALHLTTQKRWRDIAETFLWVSALIPQFPMHARIAKQAVEVWRRDLVAQSPPNFPQLRVGIPSEGRRFPCAVPREVERQFLVQHACEKCLQKPEYQEWWKSLRRSNGERPREVPDWINVQLPANLWRTEP